MKKGFRFIRGTTAILVLLSLILATACSSNNSKNDPSSAPASEPASSAPASSAAASEPAASEEPAKEPIELTFGSDVKVSGTTMASGVQTDDVSVEIQKATGVALNIDVAEDDKKFQLALASSDLPDIMYISNPKNLQALIEGGHILALDDLLQTNGKNILEERPGRLEVSRENLSNGTGKVYAIPTNVSELAPQPSYTSPALMIRWDYYRELGYPAYSSMDDILNILAQMQKNHPKNEEGKNVYAVSPIFNLGWAPFEIFDRFYNRVTTTQSLSTDATTYAPAKTIYDKDSAYWLGTKFFYKANQLGILDPDAFTQKFENLVEKTKANRVLLAQWSWSGPSEANTLLQEKDKLAGWEPLPVPAGMTQYAGEYGSEGIFGKMLVISKNAKDPARAMDWVNYVTSLEGSRLIANGVKGKHWVEENGKAVRTPETIQALQADPEFKGTSGISKFFNLAGFNSGFIDPLYNAPIDLSYDLEALKSKMSELDKDYSAHYGVSYPGELVTKRDAAGEAKIIGFNYSNSGPLNDASAAASSDLKRIDTAITEYLLRMAPKIIYAKNDAEYDKLQEEILAEMKKLKADESIAYWSEAVNKMAAIVAARQ